MYPHSPTKSSHKQTSSWAPKKGRCCAYKELWCHNTCSRKLGTGWKFDARYCFIYESWIANSRLDLFLMFFSWRVSIFYGWQSFFRDYSWQQLAPLNLDDVALLLGLIFRTSCHSCYQMWCAERRHAFKGNAWKGWSQFISLENLNNPTSGYLASVNLKLRLHFEVVSISPSCICYHLSLHTCILQAQRFEESYSCSVRQKSNHTLERLDNVLNRYCNWAAPWCILFKR